MPKLPRISSAGIWHVIGTIICSRCSLRDYHADYEFHCLYRSRFHSMPTKAVSAGDHMRIFTLTDGVERVLP